MTIQDFMNDVWSATEIAGNKVIDRRVCYGSNPDFQFTVETTDGEVEFVSAFEMFHNGVDYV